MKIGDVVKLKSGGPAMTVRDITGLDDNQPVICNWFLVDDIAQEATFFKGQLKPEVVL